MNTEFTPEQFDKIRNIPMVFIMGKERSGTTLLQTFLNAHQNIVAPPESKFILLLYPRFGGIKKWSEKSILDFVEELYKEAWIAKIWRIDRKLLTSLLLSIRDKADYASICKVVYYCMRNDKENILWFSDKNPVYALFIKTFLKIFPEAKFIHLVRDPRDNVNSHLKSFKVNNLKFVALKWVAYNNILKKAKIRMPEKFDTLLYEDLVKDTETNMTRICKFLGVTFSDEMLRNKFPESLKNFKNEKLILDRVKEVHGNLLQPVNTSNIGKWKTGLSEDDIAIIEKITGTFAVKNFNYSMEGVGKTSIGTNIRILRARVIYYCWQIFTRARYRSYRINMLYTNINIYLGRETREFGKILAGN